MGTFMSNEYKAAMFLHSFLEQNDFKTLDYHELIKERDRLIRERPAYGEIVCRCEEVSRGEIEDALRSPLPVYTVDAVKRRVRPGMGRCQGGFCLPTVMRIIAQESGLPLEQVVKHGSGSQIVFGPTK